MWIVIFAACFLSIHCWLFVRNNRLRSQLANSNTRIWLLEEKNDRIPQLVADIEKASQDRFELKVLKLQEQFNTDHVHTISQALSTASAVSLQHKMKEIVERTYSRMSQEFLGSIGDDTDEFLIDLKENLCDKVWNSLQQVKSQHEEGLFVMPEGAKMTYTKGHRTVIVIEQKPQVRSVAFVPKLVSKAEAEHSQLTPSGNYRFGLAFPYVYFFVVFDNNTYAYHEVYFRNKPLTTSREHVYAAPLPNIWKNKGAHKPVCMGENFDPSTEGPMSRQCEKVVSEFWQRPFNEHLGNGGKIDNRISNYASWQEKTNDNPLFILNMKWGRGTTALKVIDKILKARKMNHVTDVIDKDAKKMLETGVSNVIKNIKYAIDTSKKNHTLRSGDIDEIIKTTLLEVVTEHSRGVFSNCAKVE